MENKVESSEVKTKNKTFLSVIKWILASIFLFAGLVNLFSDPITGLAFLAIGIILSPLFTSLLKNKFNFALNRTIKIIAIIVLMVVAGSTSKNVPNEQISTKTNTPIVKTGDQEAQVKEQEPTPEPKVEENTVAVAPTPKTLEEKVSNAVNVSLGAQTNTKKPRLVSVDVTKYNSSMLSAYGYKASENISSVLITINSDENLTSNLQKSGMDHEATKLIQSVFPVDQNIGDIIIWSQLPIKDQYGNTKDGTAIVFSVARPLSTKINWDNFSYRDLPTLLKSEEKTDDRNGYFEKIKF